MLISNIPISHPLLFEGGGGALRDGMREKGVFFGGGGEIHVFFAWIHTLNPDISRDNFFFFL